MFIPHVGQEVIVAFEEGDPDRPLITGRVYNPDQMPPVELPAGKTKSVIRDHGGNEIIMEGAGGSQQMRLYSPTHETALTLGNSYRLFTGSDSKSEVRGNHEQDIGGNSTSKVGNDWFEIIVGKHKIEVGGDLLQFFGGVTHRNFVGMISTLIGGVKHETVIGAEVKNNLGAKSEIIRGAVFKTHVGPEYKLEKANKKEKNPSLMEQISAVKSFYGDCYRQLKGSWALKAAAKAKMKAANIKIEADETIDKSLKKLDDFSELKSKANKAELNYQILNMKSNKANLDAHLTVSNGVFEVKK